MANNLNKQKKQQKAQLLGQVKGKHKARIKRTPHKGNLTFEKSASESTTQNLPPSSRKSPTKWIVLGVIMLIALVFPKPKLITYEKLGLVSQSVYWGGLPGIDPVLFDSNLHPRPALERDTLYLCADLNNPDSCQKYQIIEQNGFISALKKLILD
ncbi:MULTISPECIES: hypothetical protein [Pseudoalteromonas]|uniref:Uncharacterized protein n=1 Tax=Pseudoalteromonas amylolytica TaxID=1859457 RepID=A0A1S1ML44_9GAMM|nr:MULTISPECIES: hypothetical protein [Pseudoalteromonas]OHU86768.1 hypothetical protein BFC16_14835 [Pseudoalteromonas sp. JW3]OHU88707.1 hypothetical protein BET10_17920 [Pseudoalteromonas amylolytica]